MPEDVSLRVVIAASGSPEGLVETLDSLALVEKPSGFLGTLVVENGPRRGIEGAIRERRASEAIDLLYSPPGNKSLALNAALEQVGRELIYFTDDDIRFEPGVLLALQDAASRSPRLAYFGGPLDVLREPDAPGEPSECVPRSRTGWDPGLECLSEFGAGEFVGANWAAYADDLRAIGGFDPMFGPGAPTGSTGQESDAQRRLSAAGVTAVYVPRMRVQHCVSMEDLSPDAVVKRSFRHGVESALKRSSGRRWAAFPLIPFRVAASAAGDWLRDEAGRRNAAARRARLLGQAKGTLLSVRLDVLRRRYLAECEHLASTERLSAEARAA